MPALRDLLSRAGFGDVRSYLQSGNLVLSSDVPSDQLAADLEGHIASAFGLEVAVVVRTRDELAEVIERNPLTAVVDNPKRYQVSFLSAAPDPAAVSRLAALATEQERMVAIGREIYAWHPDGVARSRLSAGLAGRGLGVSATARNWTTVTSVLALADADQPAATRPRR
jgi:uncharacterized protein (DUF1697 family)